MLKKLLVLALLPVAAWAWEPTRPVTVLIGFQPGSGNEVGFRVLAKQVQLANPDVKFVIELKPGADSVLATNQLAAARPDGYTISVPSYMGTFVTNDIWQKDIKTWQHNTITNVMGMGKSPMAIVANPKSKINTPAELNALLRDTVQPITFAVGAGAHRMTWEFIMDRANGNRTLVKYAQHQGPLQAVTAVASDAGMEFGIMPVAIAKPLLDAGRVKLIGISTLLSVIDFKFLSSKDTNIEEINNIFFNNQSSILAVAKDKLVSIDFNHNSHSAIFDPFETKVVNKRFVRVVAWYDNEWAFSQRMLDVARLLCK